MKQKSLIINVVYNFIYTSLNLLYPLITAPYVSRTLGASNLGKVNFASAIVNWFILFAIFGTATYGMREIAKIRDDKKKISKVFSEIFIINVIMSLIATITYIIFILNVNEIKLELPLFLIMSLSIILNMLSIDWFFQGIEEYRYITIRNAIIKAVSLIFIFLFVQERQHYIIYGLISVLGTSLNGVLNFLYSRKFVRLTISGIKPLRHFKKLKIFFLHTLIVNIYTNFDQVLLGFLTDTKSVAFLNRSKVIINVSISLASAISNATLSRSSYYNQNDNIKFKKLIEIVPNFILWVTIPITIGGIILAPNIMYILGGNEFLSASVLLQIMSVTIILIPLSTYLQNQIIIAAGHEKIGLYCSIISSLLSLTLNILAIPFLGVIGAGIVQVISEISSVGTRYYITKYRLRYKEIKIINKSSLSYLIASLFMGGTVLLLNEMIRGYFVSFIICLFLGAFVYLVFLIIIREKYTLFIIKQIMKKLKFFK